MEVKIRSLPEGGKREEHYLNDRLHDPSGPAVRQWNGTGVLVGEEYWLDAMLHNEKAPAIREWGDAGMLIYEEYWLNGMEHNEEGPAILHYNDAGELIEKVYIFGGWKLSENTWRDQTKSWEILKVISILHRPVAQMIIEHYCRA